MKPATESQIKIYNNYLNLDAMGKSKEEIIDLCEQKQISYLFFDDYNNYKNSDVKYVATYLMKDNVCIGSRMTR